MPEFGFVMEQALGHATHSQNLARAVAEQPEVCATWMLVEEQRADLWERLPGIRGNWSLKASLRARGLLRKARATRLDALLLHTQTVALFAIPFMRRVPTLVSLDATPLNYDTVGAEYGHHAGDNGWLERRKYQWSRATFQAAAGLVTWSRWAKASLVNDYGVAAEKVTVIPPGVDTRLWRPLKETEKPNDGVVRILFTGGNFARKGGDLLLRWAKETTRRGWELHLVTRDTVEAVPGVVVHNGFGSNAKGLVELAQQCDIFALPTRADCLPIALMEAMAAGLPTISTTVGAIAELVEEGKTGYLLDRDDYDGLRDRLEMLFDAPELRRTLGQKAREIACARLEMGANYGAILAQMKICARQ